MGSCPDSTLLLNVHLQVVVGELAIVMVFFFFSDSYIIHIIMWWNNQNSNREQLDMYRSPDPFSYPWVTVTREISLYIH